ncbi:MAG: FxDxF family PEP-CTERM protein [Sphingopyxis sp.]
MSKLSLSILTAVIGAGAALASAPASAAAVITCNNPANPTSCTFGNTDPATGAFLDHYSFTIPWAKVLTASFGNNYLTIAQNVNFPTGSASSTVSGGTLATPAKFTISATPNPDIRSIGPITLGAGTYSINVNGNSGPDGFYAGSLSLGAVPEPATWAFMILGFGLVGGAMRRRKSVRTNVAFG